MTHQVMKVEKVVQVCFKISKDADAFVFVVFIVFLFSHAGKFYSILLIFNYLSLFSFLFSFFYYVIVALIL